jgi:hypothetical protein
MKRADSLCIVASYRLSGWWLLSCCREYTDAFVPRYLLQPAQLSCVQPSCLEREQLAPATVFAGGLAARRTAVPDHQRLEHMRLIKAEGKTKGGGTRKVATPVCTRGRLGTRLRLRRAVYGAQRAQMLTYLRASHAGLRPCLPRTQS